MNLEWKLHHYGMHLRSKLTRQTYIHVGQSESARAGKESKTVWQYAKTTPWMGEVESSLEQRPTPIGVLQDSQWRICGFYLSKRSIDEMA